MATFSNTLETTGAAQYAADTNRKIESASTKPELQDSFWHFAQINRNYWNKLMPYRLSVLRKVGDVYRRDDTVIPPFTLPMSPESLTIETPYAITTTATLGGILEEHNGTVFKHITLQGTTGVQPLRGSVTDTSVGGVVTDQFKGVFGGVIQAAANTVGSALTLGTGTFTATNVISEADADNGDLSYSTGYYQFKLLERFLQSYANFKKTDKGRGYVLAFEAWKDDQFYLCTPQHFSMRRSANSAWEYQYALRLLAWKNVPSGGGSARFLQYAPIGQNAGAMGYGLGKLQEARRVLYGARQTLQAANVDTNNIFNAVRQAVLFAKESLGVGLKAIDLPQNIVKGFRSALLQSRQTLDSMSKDVSNVQRQLSALSTATSKTDTKSGALVGGSPQDASPVDKILDNPTDHFEFFDLVDPASLPLSPATRLQIESERTSARSLRREDFARMRDTLEVAASAFDAAVDVESGFDVACALNTSIMEFNRLAASYDIGTTSATSMDYVAGLAAGSGIAFRVPTSKFLVPFPYGATLERLAQQYLGDPSRWGEIAALNGLQTPYVDETGWRQSLLANPNDRTVAVADSGNLYVGQTVYLSSTSAPRIACKVSQIVKGTDWVSVVLDGSADLSVYTVSSQAVLEGFSPNTVNSRQSLFIPSDRPTDEIDYRLINVPGVDYADPFLAVGGVDLLLDPDNDIVYTADGDTPWAVGLTNIIQKVRLAIATLRGSLLEHPEYGFPLKVGSSSADSDAQQILAACQNLFAGDPTFQSVSSVAVNVSGPAVFITMNIAVSGVSELIPVTVRF